MIQVEIIVISISVMLALIFIYSIVEPLKRKIEKYKFKKQCHKYGVSNKVSDMEDSLRYMTYFNFLTHTASTAEHKFKRGELKNLVLKHIKNRKVTTFIKLKVLTNAKDNSPRKCLAKLKKDGIIGSRRIGKTKYKQYFLKKDIDTPTKE